MKIFKSTAENGVPYVAFWDATDTGDAAPEFVTDGVFVMGDVIHPCQFLLSAGNNLLLAARRVSYTPMSIPAVCRFNKKYTDDREVIHPCKFLLCAG